jgi:hypothetical protein
VALLLVILCIFLTQRSDEPSFVAVDVDNNLTVEESISRAGFDEVDAKINSANFFEPDTGKITLFMKPVGIPDTLTTEEESLYLNTAE